MPEESNQAAGLTVENVLTRARAVLGQKTEYKLGKGGFKPALATPAPAGQCDCTGYVAWCFGISRQMTDAFYKKTNGGWFETSAIYKDILSPVGVFERLLVPREGCVAVYPDAGGHEGHIGLVTKVGAGKVLKVIHCSSSAWKNGGDAIAENSIKALTDNPAVIYGWYSGYADETSVDEIEVLPAGGELYRVKKEVTTLNVRSAPADLSDKAVIELLPSGHPVVKVANSKKSAWWEITSRLSGKDIRGFVNATFLERDLSVPAVSPVVAVLPPPVAASIILPPEGVVVSEKAVQLILDFEGMDQPSKWPGESSGISLGHGYDLGYHTFDAFMADWSPFIGEAVLKRLAKAIGKRGSAAKAMAPQFADITIRKADADAVFMNSTLPKIKLEASRTFQGITLLPSDAQGGLVSLVYNRGSDMNGPRRAEMAEVRDTVRDQTLPVAIKLTRIAASIRAMKRLWPDTPGLRRRREAEAKLIEEAV